MDVLSLDRVRWVKRATRRSPKLGLRLAAALGAAFGPGSEWAPTPSELRVVFPGCDVRALQRRIAATLLRDVALASLANRLGSAAVVDHVRIAGAEHLLEPLRAGVPVVVVYGHVGPRRAVPLAVEKLGIPARLATEGTLPRRIGCVEWEDVSDTVSAGNFLRNALLDLTRGIVPIISVDHSHGSGPEFSYLDRRVRVGRGLAMLARAGATLVPMRGTWVGWSSRIEVTALPPLVGLTRDASRDAETAFLQRCLDWLDAYLRAHPEESGPAEIRFLAGIPRSSTAASGAGAEERAGTANPTD